MTFRRNLIPKVLLSVVAAVPVLVAAASYLRETRTDAVYNRGVLGQARTSIERQLGKPDEVLPCGEYLWWDGDTETPPLNDGRCATWVRYNFFLNAYAFGYSSSGELVSRYHYVSE